VGIVGDKVALGLDSLLSLVSIIACMLHTYFHLNTTYTKKDERADPANLQIK
jgi:hypothetical protein